MDVEPPPAAHDLRPHHIPLLFVALHICRHINKSRFHPDYLLRVHTFLMGEMLEVWRPKHVMEIARFLRAAPHSDCEGAKALCQAFTTDKITFPSVGHMTSFIQGLSFLFIDSKTGEESDLNRRSLYGYFVRRCYISFLKLSFAGTTKLREDYHAWIHGHRGAGYHKIERSLMSCGDVLLKTTADEYQYADPTAYSQFTKALTTGDSNAASENLRRFFEQHFHDGSDSGLRQHALLNMSRMHYLRHEHAAARKFLAEAINVSRTANDKETLQHCQSLLHRIPSPKTGVKPVINEIQPALHPLEVLYDIEKLLRVSSEQPLSAAFEKIVQAVGLYDHWIDVPGNVPDYSDQWGHHAVQSVVWSAAGCEKLAEIEETIVIMFTERAGDDNNALTVRLNRAYRRARKGEYKEATATLLDPDVWRSLSIHDYTKWANEIWHIFALQASRRGQLRLYNDFLKPRRPSGPFNPREYFFDQASPSASIIRDPLYEVMQLRHDGQAAISMEHLLKGLWHAEYQCRYGSYRTGIILLADVGLEFGMSKRSRKIIEEILPQVINGDNLEQRALACFTYARCIIAAGSHSDQSIREALPYLDIAEKDFTKLEILRSVADVQYLLSVLYHNLGMLQERDAAAARQLNTEEEIQAAAAVYQEQWMSEVWNLVSNIGGAIATRNTEGIY
ncbi:hypothetical protein OF83DRAFT_1172648 [Amylostereum chailletii]|nr:hypothetical protein OF83DRAFT_1172648 [Amylostereum chailletii]